MDVSQITPPVWDMVAIVTAPVRDLKGSKTGAVFSHTCSVSSLGMTFELSNRDVNVFKGLEVNNWYRFTGTFEQVPGQTRLNFRLLSFKPLLSVK